MFNWIKSLGLATRIIALTLIVLITVITVNYIVVIRKYTEAAHQALVDKAAAFTAVADATKNHAEMLQADNVFDTANLLEELAADLADGRHYSESRVGRPRRKRLRPKKGLNFV